ncbi:hypothetical protein GGQ73_003024 [Rhizobium skierniewicense]|uniref:Uncharacterized protein n=1 Tax=Rhizobium skierniewicense TaxID=984260 RepID=A0A7W6G2Q7_9HYPH|nr:hypothetical protein [Rhizobium skierniewicense]MBB3947060.1 hypothetical protein [Rhizobium skierniewicense]
MKQRTLFELRPLDKMQRAIQLAAFHYIACLKATPSNADHQVTIRGLNFNFENIRTADSNELHGEFQSWAASTVLRDVIENFSVFLMGVYRDAIANAPERSFSVTQSQFERKGIEDQLAILDDEFSVAPEWKVRLVGYNRARNCMAHRLGVVDPRDATDGSELVIRWLVVNASLAETVESDVLDIEGPMGGLIRAQRIHGAGSAAIAFEDREKRVAVGKMLQFFPDEVLEICQVFQLAAAAFSGIGRRES